MRRREFLSAGAAAALWPCISRAQPAPVPTIGVLVAGVPDPVPFLRAFREGLHDRGYVEGRNIRLDIRSAEGNPARLPQLAADLVGRRVDIIVGFQTPTIQA